MPYVDRIIALLFGLGWLFIGLIVRCLASARTGRAKCSSGAVERASNRVAPW